MNQSQIENQAAYYFSKTIQMPFEEASERVKACLLEQEFGIITEIQMHEKLKDKLGDVSVNPYRILGACNPKFAFDTMQVEENIGLFLPCKVLVKFIDESTTEVVMVNPSALMKMLGNNQLMHIADEVTQRFKKAIESI